MSGIPTPLGKWREFISQQFLRASVTNIYSLLLEPIIAVKVIQIEKENNKRKNNFRCNAGYSGDRCEVNACHAFCLHDGVCSINDKNQPECKCTADYDGDRCDTSVFLRDFFQYSLDTTIEVINEIKKSMYTFKSVHVYIFTVDFLFVICA